MLSLLFQAGAGSLRFILNEIESHWSLGGVRGKGSNFLLNAVHLVNELQRKQEWKQRQGNPKGVSQTREKDMEGITL